MSEKLIKAAINASNTITALYEWADMVEKAGGTTSIAGIAKCHAMLASMKKNKSVIDNLVMVPLQEALDDAKGEPQ
jgi:hypothetical protein